jgi:CubicO group peptidase (beta-lactamase class C family)
MDHLLPRSTPESQGIQSAAIHRFVQKLDSIPQLHSMMLVRHGSVVADTWWSPYRPDVPHMLYSLSKSFTSTAVGFAIDDGLLSLDDQLIGFFPDNAPAPAGDLWAKVTIRDLLTMSSGQSCDTIDVVLGGTSDPYDGFFSIPVEHEPGTHFVYNTGATFMLAAIVQMLTGTTVVDYLKPRLLDPLGVRDVVWDSHRNGVNLGGIGLYLRTEEIAAFGQLLLQNGVWHGKELIPAGWIADATRKQVESSGDDGPDWNQGYGYQFWRGRHNSFRGDGAWGQVCLVIPDQDAVVVMTSGVEEMGKPVEAVWDILLPAMRPEPLPENPAARAALADLLGSTKVIPPSGTARSPVEGDYSGLEYEFEENGEGLQTASVDFARDVLTVTLTGDARRAGRQTLRFGRETWIEDTAALGAPRSTLICSSGTWVAEDTFQLTMCHTETPHVLTFRFRFGKDRVFVDASVNVSFGPTKLPRLIGTLKS